MVRETGITMAAGLVALAHSLGLKIVAERVETPDQLEFLRSEDCDEVQGDVVCQPLNSEERLAFLQKRVEVLSIVTATAAKTAAAKNTVAKAAVTKAAVAAR